MLQPPLKKHGVPYLWESVVPPKPNLLMVVGFRVHRRMPVSVTPPAPTYPAIRPHGTYS